MSSDNKTARENVPASDLMNNGKLPERGGIVKENSTPAAEPPHAVGPSAGDMLCMRINTPSAGSETGNAVTKSNGVANSSLAFAKEVDDFGDDANTASHIINNAYRAYEVHAARQLNDNFVTKGSHFTTSGTVDEYKNLIHQGEYTKLPDIANRYSQMNGGLNREQISKVSETLADGSERLHKLEAVGKVANAAGLALDLVVVGADTYSTYLESGGDKSQSLSTFTASAGWNVGGAWGAAEGGCGLGALSGLGPGCAVGALAGVAGYTVLDTIWGNEIVDGLSATIDPYYQWLGDKISYDIDGNKPQSTPPTYRVGENDNEALYQDGTVVYLGDPGGLWQYNRNDDGSGSVVLAGHAMPFSASDEVYIESLEVCEPPGNESDRTIKVGVEVRPTESFHTVVSGDSLWAVAQENNIPFNDLLAWNKDLADPNKLQPGQEIRTSPPEDIVAESGYGGEQEDGIYAVRQGDTVSEPAERFGTSEEGFRQINNMPEDGPILVGQELNALSLEEIAQTDENIDETLDDYFEEIDVTEGEGEPKEERAQGTSQVALSSEENAVDSSDREAEAQHRLAVQAGEKIRGADLDVIYAQNAFSDAVSSGDGLSIIGAGLDYYAKLEDRADLGQDGHAEDSGSLSTSDEALLDSVGSAIRLGQAIDGGDGLVIAGESIGLLRNIDCYLDEVKSEYGKVIGTTGSALLGLSAAGIGLAQAIENGNDLGIAKSSVELLEGIDSYIGGSTALDTALGFDAGDALKGVGSAIGLAINISRLDDVFESGDAGAIACSVASTASSAINTYNAVAAMAGASGIVGNVVPVLGFVTAGIQLMQGDVVGAAFSAASAAVAMAVACGLMSTGIGAIAGLAIMAIQMLISDDDPPEASATFTLDASGKVVMDTHGDSAMLETAGAYGNSMIALMENYRQNGGRLLIDGSLPSVRVVQGENSAINYRSETGGRTSVVVEDASQLLKEMSAALYARDRGERIDSAIKVARDVDGKIDFAKVDAIMAGHGFGKTGITYTYGETGSRTAAAWGTGVWHGGGNVGPEGQLFIAKPGDFTSLPLRPEQLPRQQLGEILRIVSLNNLFTGPGSELMTMALGLSGGLLGMAGAAQAQNNVLVTNSDYVKPLDGVERAKYLQLPNESAQPEKAAIHESPRQPIPILADPETMRQFLTQHWPELLAETLPPPETSAPGAYLYRETIGYDGLLADGSRAPWWQPEETEDFYQELVRQGVIDSGFVEKADASFSGHLIAPEEVEQYLRQNLPAASAALPEPPPGVKTGAMFTMAEDSILRFLPAQLAENTGSGGYGLTETTCTFVSFGVVQNGRVWLEDNGDIRFAPTPGFVGTGSFVYTVMSPTGELIERLATVLVQNVNDPPQLTDDTCILPEGEIFSLDRLRDVEHTEVAMVNGGDWRW